MAIFLTHKETQFGVGDKVKVIQKILEGEKARTSTFEGMVIAAKGREANKTFTVRRIASSGIGVEKIYPLSLPTIESVEVVKKGTSGVRRAKLYYTREKSPKELEEIYSRAHVTVSGKSRGGLRGRAA